MIDIQMGINTSHGFYGTERSTPEFESNTARILSSIRKYNNTASPEKSIFIVHVFHKSKNPASPLYPTKETVKFMPCAAPIDGEVVISKNVNGAFIGTPLEKLLREQNLRQLIICGITTDHCVSTTTRMASDLGVVNATADDGSEQEGIVALVSDATATFNREKFDAETMQAASLASLSHEFAQIISTDEMLGRVVC